MKNEYNQRLSSVNAYGLEGAVTALQHDCCMRAEALPLRRHFLAAKQAQQDWILYTRFSLL